MMPSNESGIAVIRSNTSVGAVVIAEEGGNPKRFLGTAFAIGLEDPLYMTATHVVPPQLTNDDGVVCVVLGLPEGEGSVFTIVEATERLVGQPDVAILRADHRAPVLAGLAPDEVRMWETVYAVGYPDALTQAVADPLGVQVRMRGLAGTVQRRLAEGDELMIRGPTYEVSFPIPAGCSGAPVYALGPRKGAATHGLVGVCLGSFESHVVDWAEEAEEREIGERRRVEARRIVEYGLVARLGPLLTTHIDIAGKTLEAVVGRSDGTTYV